MNGMWIKASSTQTLPKHIKHITSYTLFRLWYQRLAECTMFEWARHIAPETIKYYCAFSDKMEERREDGKNNSSRKATGHITIHHSPLSTPRCYPSETGFKAENNLRLNSFFTPKKRSFYYGVNKVYLRVLLPKGG